MRVYQINVVCGNGSTGRIAVDLAQTIERHGGSCKIAYGRGSAPDTVDAIKICSKWDVYFHALMTRLTDKHGLYSKTATKRLIKDIKEYNPDIIHLHNIHGYYLHYELLFNFLREYGKPVVWTMHDCWAFTGHCAHYDSVECGKWKQQCEECPNIGTYPASLCGSRVTDNYRRKRECFNSVPQLTIVTPSLWLQQQVEHSFLGQRKCITIHNGIDLTKFSPKQSDLRQKLHCENKKLLLGVAGVWTKNKGLDDFVRLREMLDAQYAICLIGLTDKQIRKLPDGIIGITRTSDIEELAQYYSAADVFLNLTYEDTFPTTNIEALACGTPVLTYRTGGSPEILTDACGMAVEKGDLREIVNVLREEIKCKEVYKAACLNRVAEFEKGICYEKYIQLYKTMIDEVG